MTNLSPEAQAQLAKLSMDLANNPKTRKQFVGLVKEIDPSKRFPDVETDALREEFAAARENDKLEREKEKTMARLEAQKGMLKSRYDDAAIGEIEKLMEKLGISDYDVGARIYAAETKAATPTYQANDHRWNLPAVEQKDYANLKQNTRAKAMQVIDELARQRAS